MVTWTVGDLIAGFSLSVVLSVVGAACGSVDVSYGFGSSMVLSGGGVLTSVSSGGASVGTGGAGAGLVRVAQAAAQVAQRPQ